MAVTVDSVIVELEAKIDRYNADVNRAHANFTGKMTSIEAAGFKMGSSLRSAFSIAKTAAVGFVGALGVEAIIGATRAGLEYAGSLGEVAQSLGVTTGFLQEFRYAATQNGASVEGADNALGKFSITLGKAFDGGKQAVDAFKGLGLSLTDLKAASDSERFQLVADAIAKIKDPAQQSAAAVAIFGRGAKEIIPTLISGAEAFRRQAAEARAYGIVLSDSQIQDADKVADKIDALNRALSAKIAGVVADNAEAIGGLANKLFDLVNASIRAVQALANFDAAIRKYNTDATVGERVGFIASVVNGDYVGAARNAGDVLARNKPKPAAVAKRGPLPKVDLGGITPVAGGKGGGGKSAAEINRDALQKLARFNDDLARAKVDVLQALESMAVEYADQAAYQREIREAQRAADVSRINSSDDLTKAQKASLVAETNRVAAIDFDRINREENTRIAEESLRTAQSGLANDLDILRLQDGLARTAAKHQEIQLRILDAEQQQERLALEKIIADTTSTKAAKDEAVARLAALDQIKGLKTDAIRQDNAGPLQRYLQEFDDPHKDIEEAVVQKLRDVDDAISSAAADALGVKDPFLRRLLQIFLEQNVLKPLYEAFSSGSGSGGGGLIGAVGSLLGTIFKPRASGGNVVAGQHYQINETGVEGFQAAQSGKIIPLGRMNAAARSAGGGGMSLTVVVNANDAVLADTVRGWVADGVAIASAQGAMGGAELAKRNSARRVSRALGRGGR